MSHLEKFLVAKSAEQSASDAAAVESAAMLQQQHHAALLRLRDQLSDIRAKYLDDLEDIEPTPSQHALCTYFIDRFAFGIGFVCLGFCFLSLFIYVCVCAVTRATLWSTLSIAPKSAPNTFLWSPIW
jgi:hypothetical protein